MGSRCVGFGSFGFRVKGDLGPIVSIVVPFGGYLLGSLI